MTLYRDELRIRYGPPGFAGEAFRWIDASTGVLAFASGPGVRCVVNHAGGPRRFARAGSTRQGREPLEGHRLSARASIWDAAEGYDR